MDILPFDRLVEALKKAYFKIVVREQGYYYRSAYFLEGEDLKGGFFEPNHESSWYLDGKICVDNAKVFNKYSSCPLCMKLPETDEDAKLIVERLKFLETNAGAEWSNQGNRYEDNCNADN